MSDDSRVEPRNLLVGRGMGVTPEKVEEIEQRRVQSERLSRPPPTKPFKEVLSAALDAHKQAAKEVAKEDSAAETEIKKNKKPTSNLSPYQRSLMGLDDDENDDKIIVRAERDN